MRVLHLAWEHPPRLWGGLGRHLEGLTRAQAGLDRDVHVLTPALAAGQAEAPAVQGVTVHRADPSGVPLPAEAWVASVLEANDAMGRWALAHARAPGWRPPDVLHVHDWMAGHAGRLLAEVWAVPLVATIHATERGRHAGHLPPGPSAWIDAQEAALVAAAASTIVCAPGVRREVVGWLGGDPSLVHVAPGGVDAERWAGGGEADRRTDRVVFAGRLEHEKGVQVLLEAVDALTAGRPRRTGGRVIDLCIAGAGTGGEAIAARAAELPALPPPRFLGRLPQDALAALLRTATVVVVPSLYEPFGLVALEAMAAGAPVIASDVGGLSAQVEDVGLLVPPGDAVALADAIARLLDDADARQVAAAAGRARAAERTWEATAIGVDAAYRAAVLRPAGRDVRRAAGA